MTVDKIVFAHDSEEFVDAVSRMPLERIEAYSRDPVNATDDASTESVMLEYIEKNRLKDDDIFILAQATSPLTSDRDVDAVVRMILDKGYDSALSCVRLKRFLWSLDGRSLNYDYKHRPRRQEFDGCMMENGALYASRVSIIRALKCRIGGSIAIYEMKEDTATEIDEPSDWAIVSSILRRRLPRVSFFFSDVDGVLTDGGMYYGNDRQS
jgi:N-acylneuraminate cytidylyltransferase